MPLSPVKFSVLTLGCKANQFDSALISQQLKDNGCLYTSNTSEAGILIVNTCSVTEKADYKARQLVRKIRKENPGAKIVVTGCYAERQGEKLTKMTEIDLLLGNKPKETIVNHLTGAGLLEIKPDGMIHSHSGLITGFEGKTRALVKIQDGCDQYCTYCVVPYLRGNVRSVNEDTVVEQLQILERNDYKEAVLTGIHIGKWGSENGEGKDLLFLLKNIRSEVGMRIRLSSLEPQEIDEKLIDFVLSNSQIRPHFHIPLQSGSDNILRAMKRPYSAERFVSLVEYIRKADKFAAIGSDIIVGFPGSTEKDANKTYDIIERLPVTYLHVFPYSKRSGTEAARIKDSVSDNIKTERAAKLRKLGEQKRREFALKQLGHTREAITFSKKAGMKMTAGISDNYLSLSIEGSPPANSIVQVRLENIVGDKVITRVV